MLNIEILESQITIITLTLIKLQLKLPGFAINILLSSIN